MGTETINDLRPLLEHGPGNGCWCVYWELPREQDPVWGQRTPQQNRELREHLWAEGRFGGYVFYVDRTPSGWCRVAPRKDWPKLCQYHKLDPSQDVWSITCFGMLPQFRGRGLLHEFLKLILEDLRSRGVQQVEAFPKNLPSGARADPEHVWNGPPALFERAGFVPVMTDERATHVMKDLTKLESDHS